MKTGRLLKFRRPEGDLHAYLYLEGESARAALYRLAPGQPREPLHEIRGRTAEEVEASVRAWIEAHYPKRS